MREIGSQTKIERVEQGGPEKVTGKNRAGEGETDRQTDRQTGRQTDQERDRAEIPN